VRSCRGRVVGKYLEFMTPGSSRSSSDVDDECGGGHEGDVRKLELELNGSETLRTVWGVFRTVMRIYRRCLLCFFMLVGRGGGCAADRRVCESPAHTRLMACVRLSLSASVLA